jgi:predicted LPLAT superfamily acyltransferase
MARAAANLPHVAVVAQDVGEFGGMASQVAILVKAYLDAGGRVSLLTRRTDLPKHHSLRVIRIRGPRRPFPLREPWFMLAASLRLRSSAETSCTAWGPSCFRQCR